MKINIRLTILLVTSMLLILVAGCAKDVEGFGNELGKGQSNEINSAAEDEGPIVLKLWSWYSFQGIIDNFEEEYKGIKVEEELKNL